MNLLFSMGLSGDGEGGGCRRRASGEKWQLLMDVTGAMCTPVSFVGQGLLEDLRELLIAQTGVHMRAMLVTSYMFRTKQW
jgi:hypothetical protein